MATQTHNTVCAEKGPKMEAVVQSKNKLNWKLTVGVIVPVVLVVVVLFWVILFFYRYQIGQPLFNGQGVSTDDLDHSRASDEYAYLGKGNLPIITAANEFPKKSADLKVNIHNYVTHEQLDRNSPDSAYDSRKCSTEEISGYIIEPSSDHKNLLNTQDSIENPGSNPSIIIIRNMHLMQGEHTVMNINNKADVPLDNDDITEGLADAAQQTYGTIRHDSTSSDLAWPDDEGPEYSPYDHLFTTKYDGGESMEAWPDSAEIDNNNIPPAYDAYQGHLARHTEL